MTLKVKTCHFLTPPHYSMVPNNSAARLLIFKIFSLPTRLIWTYTLIKIQIIFLPTCLLSTIFYFFYLFLMLFAAFFCYKCLNNAFFHLFSSFYYSRVRNKRSPTIINFLTFFQGLRPYSGLHSIR